MSRRALILLLRVGMASALLLLVFRVALPPAPGVPGAIERLRAAWTAPPAQVAAWLAVALAMLGAAFAVAALRFHLLLSAAGLPGRFGVVLRAYVIAGFFNLVLPGLILGDVYRLVDARREARSGSAVLGVLVLERLLGFAALGAIALLAVPWLPIEAALGDAGVRLRLAAGALAAAVLVGPLLPLVAPGRRLVQRLARLLGRLSGRAGTALDTATTAMAGAARAPGVLLRAFALSLLAQGLPVAAVFALAQPLDANVPALWYAVIVPFVTLASLLPISIGGAGVREGLFVALFGAVGMRAEVALALSLSTLAAALLWGAVGLALFAHGRRSGARAAATLRRPA